MKWGWVTIQVQNVTDISSGKALYMILGTFAVDFIVGTDVYSQVTHLAPLNKSRGVLNGTEI